MECLSEEDIERICRCGLWEQNSSTLDDTWAEIYLRNGTHFRGLIKIRGSDVVTISVRDRTTFVKRDEIVAVSLAGEYCESCHRRILTGRMFVIETLSPVCEECYNRYKAQQMMEEAPR